MMETLELKMIRLPAQINATTAPQIRTDLDRFLQPETAVMLDFSRTEVLDPEFVDLFSFAHQLAQERSACLARMGDQPPVTKILQASGLLHLIREG
jgi:anti-anti-sigma regulatory factor